jgi:site-specific DNA-adenine methylase
VTRDRLVPPCSYQGGKQRISRQVVDHILANATTDSGTRFFDVCCGSGAITVELLNRGVAPEQIVMIDLSSWGAVWQKIGEGSFDLDIFRAYLDRVPENKSLIHAFATELATQPASVDEVYKYLVLQACSFGGKQIWRDGEVWRNAFFRRHWMPTASSVRRSPANPMQPGAKGLYERVARLVDAATGVRALRADVSAILLEDYDAQSVIYVDPPYLNTTAYGFDFDITAFVDAVQAKSPATLFVSEAAPVSSEAVRMNPEGARGGISGNRRIAHEEWLSSFRCA